MALLQARRTAADGGFRMTTSRAHEASVSCGTILSVTIVANDDLMAPFLMQSRWETG